MMDPLSCAPNSIADFEKYSPFETARVTPARSALVTRLQVHALVNLLRLVNALPKQSEEMSGVRRAIPIFVAAATGTSVRT